MEENPKENKLKDSQNKLNDYAKYSGIAFQMLAVILAGVWGGKKLDEKYLGERMIFTPILSLLGVFLAIYIVIKDLIKKNKTL